MKWEICNWLLAVKLHLEGISCEGYWMQKECCHEFLQFFLVSRYWLCCVGNIRPFHQILIISLFLLLHWIWRRCWVGVEWNWNYLFCWYLQFFYFYFRTCFFTDARQICIWIMSFLWINILIRSKLIFCCQ